MALIITSEPSERLGPCPKVSKLVKSKNGANILFSFMKLNTLK
jgi:hypothetical protein